MQQYCLRSYKVMKHEADTKITIGLLASIRTVNKIRLNMFVYVKTFLVMSKTKFICCSSYGKLAVFLVCKTSSKI